MAARPPRESFHTAQNNVHPHFNFEKREDRETYLLCRVDESLPTLLQSSLNILLEASQAPLIATFSYVESPFSEDMWAPLPQKNKRQEEVCE